MTVVGTKNAKEKNMEDRTLILTMKDGKKKLMVSVWKKLQNMD